MRDYLERIKWDKNPPVPELTPEVIEGTSKKYLESHRRLLGRTKINYVFRKAFIFIS